MAPHLEFPPEPNIRKPTDKRIRSPELLIEKWLSQPHGNELIASMEWLGLERIIIARGKSNLADEMWLGRNESERKNAECALRMMEKRIAILTAVTGEYCKLTENLGWGIDAVERSATILMPYFDVSERTCYSYYGHPYRSMQYAEMILDSRGVYGDERATILLGVLLHDIGKIGVPGSLLRKDGMPTHEEKMIIRRHAEYGSAIIKNLIGKISVEGDSVWSHGKRIAEIVFTHQEHVSGEGYPRGLVREQIDIGGRVAGLCDSIEAMSSERIYRKIPSATFEEVVKRAKVQLDRQFNSNLVQNFLDAARSPEVKDRIFDIIRSAGGVP